MTKKKEVKKESMISPELLTDLNTLMAIRASNGDHPQDDSEEEIRERIHENMPKDFIRLLSMLIGSGSVQMMVIGCDWKARIVDQATSAELDLDGLTVYMGRSDSRSSVFVNDGTQSKEPRAENLAKFFKHIAPWWAKVGVADMEEETKKRLSKSKKKTAKKVAKKKAVKKKGSK
jgi:site-specific DNA-adenine methylase